MTTPQLSNNGTSAIPVYATHAENMEQFAALFTSAQQRWLKVNHFSGSAGEICLLPQVDGHIEAVAFGLGVTGKPPQREIFGQCPFSLPEGVYQIAGGLSEPEAHDAAMFWLLSAYQFTRYKKAARSPAELLLPKGPAAARINHISTAATLTRDLINTPAEHMGPKQLEAATRELAGQHQAGVEVIFGDELLEQNYPMIHAVGRAGPQEPRLIDLRWGQEGMPKVTLVGKGVCFDTGGLDIKPSSSMRLMKKDMGGAATVLGLASMIMALRLPVRLRVLIPAVENSISSNAFRPGDVLISRSGQTVEIGNTDAEGRLVLADALSEAASEEPDLLIDMATLTGAARVALGPDLPPVYTPDDHLAAELINAANAVHDPLWRMPLWAPYKTGLSSAIADTNNISPGGFAGSITAALFLQRFIGDITSWVHADIYGWVPKQKPGAPKGGAFQAARAFLELIERRFGAG